MTDQPLRPFSPPSDLLAHLPAGLSAGVVTTWILYAVFVFWAVYTIVAVYHWLKYSHGSWLTFPAIAIHLFISFALMSYALTGNAFALTPYLP